MLINLKEAREAINISEKEAARAAGLNPSFYKKFEEKNEIPSKYVYNIWKEYNDYPIPGDFFYYTSYTLQANMAYYHITQMDLAKMFGYASQGVISRILADNVPMYEKKDVFLKNFRPLIVPLYKKEDGRFAYITTLTARGNFMRNSKKEK